MKQLLITLALLVLTCVHARAETGDADDWTRIKNEVESSPSSIASFDMLHLWKDGWKSVNRPDHPFMHVYEHQSGGNYACDIKENGNMNMQHIVSATPCAQIVVK